MQTFKAFYKILKKNSISIGVYFGIFILLAIITTATSDEDVPNAFGSSNVNFTIIDQDNSELSKALLSYLSKDNSFIEFDDNMNNIRIAMYYRQIYYALIIPKGFENDIKTGKKPKTESIKLSDSSFGFLFDRKIDSYFATLHTYLSCGDDLNSAIQKIEPILDDTTKVSLLSELQTKKTTNDNSAIFNYYNILAYVFVGILITAVSPILVVFRKKILKNRITISSETFHSHNIQLAIGVVLCAVITVGIFNLIAFILFHKYLTVESFLLYIINTMCFAIVSVSLAFMAGNLSKQHTSVLGFAVVAPLAIAFLGGIFVPVSELGSTMQSVAKLMPSYWYSQSLDIISTGTGNLTHSLSAISENLLIQLLFALALFCIGLVAAKKQQES